MMQRLEELESRTKQSVVRGESAEHESTSKALADEISEQLPIEEESMEHVIAVNNTHSKQVSFRRVVRKSEVGHILYSYTIQFFRCNVITWSCPRCGFLLRRFCIESNQGCEFLFQGWSCPRSGFLLRNVSVESKQVLIFLLQGW